MDNSPAPVACTLTADAFRQRAQWLRALRERALVSHRLDGACLHLIYRPEARADVVQMVRQEQGCCGFLRFELRATASAVEVLVTGPQEMAGDAQALFAHLVG